MNDDAIRALIAESEARTAGKLQQIEWLLEAGILRIGAEIVPREEARATLPAAPAEAEPGFGRLYEFPGRSA
jgi:hypothetical protein